MSKSGQLKAQVRGVARPRLARRITGTYGRVRHFPAARFLVQLRLLETVRMVVVRCRLVAGKATHGGPEAPAVAQSLTEDLQRFHRSCKVSYFYINIL